MTSRLIIFLLLLSSVAIAQVDSAGRQLSEFHNHYSVDTVMFRSKKISIQYTLVRTYNLRSKFFRKDELIFNDSINKCSRMQITYEHGVFKSLATIPIDDLIIDDSNELIIVLSRAMVSPYNLVIYNHKGELLFKKRLLPFELVLDSLEFIKFRKTYPKFYKYANDNKQISQKTNNLYYIDLDYWSYLEETEQEKIRHSDWYKSSHYFPGLFPESIDGGTPITLKKYQNFYSQTDPFYDYDYANGKISGIILNDEYGGKVKIPVTLN